MDTLNSLSIFNQPSVQSAVEKSRYVKFRPLGSITEGSPIDIYIPGNGSSFTDLSRSLLDVKFKVVKEDGGDMDPTHYVGIINNILHSLWQNIEVYFNQVLVSNNNSDYPYKAYFDVLLNNTPAVQESRLQASGWFIDQSGSMDSTQMNPGSNLGLTIRHGLISTSSECQVVGNLLCDLTKLTKYLVNSVDIHLRLHPSKTDFILVKAETLTEKFKLKILDISYNVCRVTPAPAILAAQHELMTKTPAKYPFVRTRTQLCAIPKGSYQLYEENIFQFQCPARLVIGFVNSSAFSGSLTLNPFNFKHLNTTSIALYVDGVSVPSEPMLLNFESGSVMDGYHSLFSALNIDNDNGKGLNINRSDYSKGFTLFAFSLMPGDDGYLMSKKVSNLRLEAQFKEATTEAVTAIIVGYFPDYFEIDVTRNIIKST